MGDLADLLSVVDEKTTRAIAEKWRFLDGADLATQLPPVPYVCEALGIAPGAVTIVGGAGFGGKTMALQSMALSVATGQPLWGHFAVRSGAVKHLDWEQGRPLTQARYQRLARQMRIELGALRERLMVSCLPEAHLDDTTAEREMSLICENVTMVIVDAFRGAFPTAQENDSGVRKWLDMLARVSLRTGCTVMVIAHSRKMSADVDVRSSLRGSSGLFDACQSCFMLDGARNKPTQVHHTKDRVTGVLVETFGLQISDVIGAVDGDRRWGLDVQYLSGPDVQAAYMVEERDDNSVAINLDRIRSLGDRVLGIVYASGGLTSTQLRATTGAAPLVMAAALQFLEQAGSIRGDGPGANRLYTAAREPGDD